jgi:hypothetical protein
VIAAHGGDRIPGFGVSVGLCASLSFVNSSVSAAGEPAIGPGENSSVGIVSVVSSQIDARCPSDGCGIGVFDRRRWGERAPPRTSSGPFKSPIFCVALGDLLPNTFYPGPNRAHAFLPPPILTRGILLRINRVSIQLVFLGKTMREA